MSRTISLRIFKNEQLIASRSFSQAVIKIGKLRSSDLHLEDDTVARMHAVLEVTTNDIRLVDLGSAAGVAKNGERVIKSAAVASGDSLHVGPFRIEVQALAAEAPIAVAPVHVAAPSPSFAVATAAATAVAVAPTPAPAPHSASHRAALPIDIGEVERPEHDVAEVVARYRGTVLDVQHVGQVRSRSKQAPAFLALGGLMLLAGAGIMANEVSQDWTAHQEATAQALTTGRPAPEAPGNGLGGLGMTLALLGLVPFGLGLVRRQDVGLDRYTVGEGHDATFHAAADGLPDGDAFPLVSKQDEGLVLRFAPSMRGHVSVEGRRTGLDELVRNGRVTASGSAWAMPLPRGARAKLEHGGITYEVAAVAAGKATARGNQADKPFWLYNAASFAVLGTMLTMVHLVPEEALGMNMDEVVSENRFVGYMQQPNEEPEQPEVPVEEDEVHDEETGDQGKRHVGNEGKMGDPKAPAKSALYALKGNKNAISQMARNFDPELTARTAGILGMMERESGHFLSSPFGGAFAVGKDDADVWGGLTGTEVGTAFGMAGMGVIGTGRGGGGNGEGTIGLGNLGTIGKTGKGEGGDNYGPRGINGPSFKDRKKKQPFIAPAKGGNIVGIDKDVIRRIIRAHHNEIRSCYNQGLSKNPNMQGRVAVMFTIGPAGTVPRAAVAENTLGDSDTANCVASRVKRWTFPKPLGGGTAMVTYPFAFTLG